MEDGEHSSPESSIDGDKMAGEGVSDYEKQRLARISENKARMEALGLPHLASSFLRSSSEQKPRAQNLKKRKGMRSRGRGGDEEEEYRPSDDDGAAEDDDKEENSSAGEEEEEDFRISSRSRRKVKNRSSLITAKVKRSSIANEDLNESDIFDDEASLKQAIALSLEATIGDSTGTSAWLSKNSTSDIASKDPQKYKGKVHKSAARRKKTRKLVKNVKKESTRNNARVQLTEDEVVAYFLSFDETGKGYVTPRDVKRMASSHDFSWTDTEIRQMIHSFDNDGDGKIAIVLGRRSMVTSFKNDALKYPVLTRSNYGVWAIRMMGILDVQDALEAVEPIDPTAQVDAKKNKIAFSAIQQALPDDVLQMVAEKKTAKEI
ncbi:hypothetical protein KSP39_PZI022932 [Platanthera zijinensis]|uniref:EF-hand domain-containing protein n=1 Tax=Platanthera zijinensis TaxID=2320716 RepID=A0AAP0FUL5_9ASPA